MDEEIERKINQITLCSTRIIVMLHTISELNVKRKINLERLIIYDFYLEFPSLMDRTDIGIDFDAQFAYFHWKPDYHFYEQVISLLIARELIEYEFSKNTYLATDKASEFVKLADSHYIQNLIANTKLLVKMFGRESNKRSEEVLQQKLSVLKGKRL